MAARKFDPKFKNAGKQPGLQIWRIKEFSVEDVPKELYGNFYEGDSYIILHTKNSNSFDVHFWLGRKTTQDEMGTAAIKTVELDDALGGLPVQWREVQDHESALFFTYFKNGIKYLDGGHETGFNHVVDQLENFKPKLFHCKGKRNVRCTQVPVIKESLNLGDVFILDKGKDLYVWMPPESGRLERMKGVQQAESIRDQERAGRPKIHVLDGDWNTNNEWWKHFGGKQSVGWIKSPYGGGQDENYWLDKTAQITLYRCSDSSGKLTVEKIKTGHPDAKQLDTNDCFIVDADAEGGIYDLDGDDVMILDGINIIYVWVGTGANKDEKDHAKETAQMYLEASSVARHKKTTIDIVFQGKEPPTFKKFFRAWDDKLFQGQLPNYKNMRSLLFH
uniref:Gelsolin-like domain-containing protein n=1 Tax=Panagrolaimus sp. PS1159 TaxID=55785 RepID=A0AC35FV92_9BILA